MRQQTSQYNLTFPELNTIHTPTPTYLVHDPHRSNALNHYTQDESFVSQTVSEEISPHPKTVKTQS